MKACHRAHPEALGPPSCLARRQPCVRKRCSHTRGDRLETQAAQRRGGGRGILGDGRGPSDGPPEAEPFPLPAGVRGTGESPQPLVGLGDGTSR